MTVQCRDKRRLDPSMRIVPGTDCAALRHETKSPRPAPRALAQNSMFQPYRLTWTLVPPTKGPAPWAPSPLETTLTQSASLSL